MIRTAQAPLLAGSALSLIAATATAHHSFHEFDTERQITIQGEVKELRWVNPHSALHVHVTGKDGAIEEWTVELGSTTALLRQGLDRGSLPPGTRVVVTGSPARDGSPRMTGLGITSVDDC